MYVCVCGGGGGGGKSARGRRDLAAAAAATAAATAAAAAAADTTERVNLSAPSNYNHVREASPAYRSERAPKLMERKTSVEALGERVRWHE